MIANFRLGDASVNPPMNYLSRGRIEASRVNSSDEIEYLAHDI